MSNNPLHPTPPIGGAQPGSTVMRKVMATVSATETKADPAVGTPSDKHARRQTKAVDLPSMTPGKIVHFNQLEGYGFVKSFGERYFFHVSQFASPRIPKVGDCVLIVPGKARPGSDKTPKVRQIEFDVEREKTEAKAASTSKSTAFDTAVAVLFWLAMRSVDFFFSLAICIGITWFLSYVLSGIDLFLSFLNGVSIKFMNITIKEGGYYSLICLTLVSFTWAARYMTPELRSVIVRDLFGGLLKKIYITNEQINTFFGLVLGLAMQYGLINFVFWVFSKRQEQIFGTSFHFTLTVIGFSICWIYQFAPYVLGLRSYEDDRRES